MDQKPAAWTTYALTSATLSSRRAIDSIAKLAQDIAHDVRHEQRHEAQLCKACFYRTALGGAAMTRRPCACCEEQQMYGSTNTNVLCKLCARIHGLCTRCGADVELRTQRRNWPTTPVEIDE